jgi:hypothetical protein
MERKARFDPFAQTAHDKADAAIERARQNREQAAADLRRRQAERTSHSEPCLVRDGNLERCSVCGHPFADDVRPSMSVAFAEHLNKAHRPAQGAEDANPAASS